MSVRTITACGLILLALSGAGRPAYAAESNTPAETMPVASATASPGSEDEAGKLVSDSAEPSDGEGAKYADVPVYIDGLLYARAVRSEGALYLSPEPLCGFLGLNLNWEGDKNSIRLTVQGAELIGDSSLEYMTVSGRYIYNPHGWLIREGQLLLPTEVLHRLLNVQLEENTALERLEIHTEDMSVIAGGENYYELNFPSEDLFWLSQIINSEARWQPLAGMIAVGNVVQNRVRSDDFPDTIFDVVFDVSKVVQFEPVSTGGIYAEPDEEARIAACLCLEGYNTVGECLYFVNPEYGSFWFDENLTFALAIGDHNFYY